MRLKQALLTAGIVAVIAASAAVQARAQNTSLITPHGTYMLVRPMYRPAVVFHKDLREPEEIAARERAWEARCRPTVSAPNALGVRHYIYAAPGCEYGD